MLGPQGHPDGLLSCGARSRRSHARSPMRRATLSGWIIFVSTANTITIRYGRNAAISRLRQQLSFAHRRYRYSATRSRVSSLNHIGHSPPPAEAICKALLLGGVTRRFPELRFTFLEGGVGWACTLYHDLVGHWEKRNTKALEPYNPRHSRRAFDAQRLFGEYGGEYGDGQAEAK